jgi:hypothetical protein
MDTNSNGEVSISLYIEYLISNLSLTNDWIEKFGIGGDEKITEHINTIANELNSIRNRMGEMGIDISEIHNEGYDVDKHSRDFKIKRILKNEGN